LARTAEREECLGGRANALAGLCIVASFGDVQHIEDMRLVVAHSILRPLRLGILELTQRMEPKTRGPNCQQE
jgi:hypothetical protein